MAYIDSINPNTYIWKSKWVITILEQNESLGSIRSQFVYSRKINKTLLLLLFCMQNIHSLIHSERTDDFRWESGE